MSNRSRVLIRNLRPTKKASTTKRGVYYIGVDSQDISLENQRQWFNNDHDLIKDPKDFVKGVETHRALKHYHAVKSHHLVFSLKKHDYEAYKKSGKDYKDIVRAVLADYERKHGMKLEWIAHIHESAKSQNHPHCHVIVRGVSADRGDRGYKRVYFKKEDSELMRKSFESELEREAQYKFLERLDIQDLSKDFSKAFESVSNTFADEARKRKQEQEFERGKNSKSKGRGR